MSNTSIQLKKSGQTGNTPSGLSFGEVAINYADGKLYYKNDSGGLSYISNQLSFDTINANNSLILATGISDTLSFVAGNNINIDTNTSTKTITISSTASGGSGADQFARDTANAAFIQANAAFNTANTGGGATTDQYARDAANSAGLYANGAFVKANTATTDAAAADSKAVTAGSYANSAYNQANTATNNAASASLYANAAFDKANTGVANTANTATTANVAINARITIVNTGIYYPIVTDTTITGSDTFHYSSNDFQMYAANNTFRATGNVWAGQFIAVGSNIPVVNSTGHWVGQPLVANNSSTANVSNVAINARITVVNTGIYYPIVTDTTITGSDTLHYSSNDFVMFASNNTFRATGNLWAGQFLAVGSNIPVVNSTGHWVGQTLTAIDETARTTANNAYVQANTATTNAATADSKAVSAGSYANSAFTAANSNYTSAVTKLTVTNSGSTAYLIDQYSGNNPSIYVSAGETIAFLLNGITGHPFLIRVSSGGANYNTGLTHVSTTGVVTTESSAQAKESGVLYWKVPFDLIGSTYVYQCQVHSEMLGNIVIQQPASFVATNTQAAFVQANAAYTRANNSLNANTGGTVTGNLTVTAFTNLGAVSNVIITGGTADYVLRTDGSGNLSWVAQSGGGSGADQYARDTANAAFIQANAAFIQANTGNASTDQYARDIANAAFIQANTDFTNITITSPGTYGNATYVPVITVTSNGRINTISTIAVTGGGGGSDPAAGNTANAAFIQANAAFNAANTTTSNNDSTLSGTIIPLANTSDQFNILGITGDITIYDPAGTPTEGQKLIIRIKDAGTSVNLSWNVIYRSIGVNLPSTTSASKTAYIGFVYNTTDTKWDAVAVSLQG